MPHSNKHKRLTPRAVLDRMNALYNIKNCKFSGTQSRKLARITTTPKNELQYDCDLKIELYSDLVVVRLYDHNLSTEYNIDFGLHVEGYYYISGGVYDDENYEEQSRNSSILALWHVRVMESEEEYFQHSTVSDLSDFTLEDMNLCKTLFQRMYYEIMERIDA
jgi:hypothetical protein